MPRGLKHREFSFKNKRKKKIKLKPRPRPPLKVSIVIADIKKIAERSSLRSLGSGRGMLMVTMKKCVHIHLSGGSRGKVQGARTSPPPSV